MEDEGFTFSSEELICSLMKFGNICIKIRKCLAKILVTTTECAKTINSRQLFGNLLVCIDELLEYIRILAR